MPDTPIRPILIHKRSPFLGDVCALCKLPFNPGDEIVVCPEDGSRHHLQCWQANDNRCTAYGCDGQGEIGDRTIAPRRRGTSRPATTEEPSRRRKVRVMPSSSYGCAQSCLVVGIALAIIIFAVACFGIWAIADYIMIELLNWQYRPPLDMPFSAASILIAVQSLNYF